MYLKNLVNLELKGGKDYIWYGSADCSNMDFSHGMADTDLLNISGSFAIILEQKNEITIISDSVRSIPVFYCIYGKEIVIGNNGVDVAKYCNKNMDESAKIEFLHTSYVTGDRTLFKDVYSILPGECVQISKIDGTITKRFYWELKYESEESKTEVQLLSEFDDCMTQVFRDLIARLDGKTVLLPLSGGCDSRIVAVMFKRLGYEKVVCFSYGREKNFEAVISEQIAKVLGYPWEFVAYTRKTWENLYKSEIRQQYLLYSCNANGMGSIRGFPAMLELREKYKDCVIIPGHTLDVISGSHLPKWQEGEIISREDFINWIMKKHYNLHWHPGECDICGWADRIPEYLQKENAVKEIMYFEWLNRQPKFVVNEVRKYEFLGYKGWEIPFWDYRVCSFMAKLPVHMLEGRYFQYKYMEKIIDPIAGVHINYFKSRHIDSIKRKLSFPIIQSAYHILNGLKRYKRDEMAFYEYVGLREYLKWLKSNPSIMIHAKNTEESLKVVMHSVRERKE